MSMRMPVLPFLLAIVSLGVDSTMADPPSVLYRLEGEDTFQEGCFGECLCPVMAGELEGTFTLTPADSSDGFERWTVGNVDWQVLQSGIHLTGSGLYQRWSGEDAQQQLILDLSFDGGPLERYDSGVVPAEAPFPRIDVLASLFDMTCYDRVLFIEASPSIEFVAFRFEANVTSVFDGLAALGDGVEVGDRLRGFYVFDPSTPNTAPPVNEGHAGLYHHELPPAGVRMRVAEFVFSSDWRHLDFDIIVNDDILPAGTDEYGFVSRSNRAFGLFPTAPIDRLDLDWLASTTTAEPFDSADLPLTPPDLDLLGGGLLTIEGECTMCASPAAFFRIEATLTSLTQPVSIWLDREHLWWESPEGAWEYDVVRGDLGALRATRGFAAATEQCLVDDTESTVLAHDMTLESGEGVWFLVRPVNVAESGTYDSCGLLQDGTRDDGVEASGLGCPSGD